MPPARYRCIRGAVQLRVSSREVGPKKIFGYWPTMIEQDFGVFMALAKAKPRLICDSRSRMIGIID